MAHRKNTIFLVKGHNIQSFLPQNIDDSGDSTFRGQEESMQEKKEAYMRAAGTELWSVKNNSPSHTIWREWEA